MWTISGIKLKGVGRVGLRFKLRGAYIEIFCSEMTTHSTSNTFMNIFFAQNIISQFKMVYWVEKFLYEIYSRY